MNFSSQVRAARASLYWEQKKLANEAGLSIPAIQKVERGETGITARTQNKIIRAFEKQGVTFSASGIEHHENPIYFTEGKTHEEAYLKILEDVLDCLTGDKIPELLIMYADDYVSPDSVNNMYRKIRAAGVKMRQLICEDNTYILGPLEEYRYIPKRYFINRVTLIYGDRIANETADSNRGVIRIDPINAKIQRNTFDLLWSVLKQPTKTTADESFE
jgi:transcriptional regulator with XRE-family HTH domain